jgi:hypothetical protein
MFYLPLSCPVNLLCVHIYKFICCVVSYKRDMAQKEKQMNSVAFSPQANYTDWATAAGRRILLPNFADRRYCRPDDGGAKILRNVGSYKSHTALTSQKTAFFIVTAVKTSNLAKVKWLNQEQIIRPAYHVQPLFIKFQDQAY